MTHCTCHVGEATCADRIDDPIGAAGVVPAVTLEAPTAHVHQLPPKECARAGHGLGMASTRECPGRQLGGPSLASRARNGAGGTSAITQ